MNRLREAAAHFLDALLDEIAERVADRVASRIGTTDAGPELLDAHETAARARIGRSTLDKYRHRSENPFPPPDREIAGRLYWRPESVDAWLESASRPRAI